MEQTIENNKVILESTFSISSVNSSVVISVSENIYELLGFTSDNFLDGKVLLKDLIHPHDIDISESLFSIKNIPISGSFNLRLRHKDSHIVCIKAIYRKISSNEKEESILELKLQDSKSLWDKDSFHSYSVEFKSMMANTNDYIYFKDRNHVFTGASQTLVSLTEPSQKWTDLLGKTDYDVFPEEYADIYYSLEKQVFNGINVAHEIQETLDNEGNNGWVDNRKYPILDDNKQIIGLFGVARDITASKNIEAALKLSEKRFRAIFEESPLGVALLNSLTGHIYEANIKYAEIIGRSLAEIETIDWMSITHPDDVQEDLDNMESLNSGKVQGFNMEKRLIRPSGSHVWINLTVARITVDDKSKPLHLAMIEDITEKKKGEEELKLYQNHLEDEINKRAIELKLSQDQLIHSEKLASLGKFAGTIAHEFNNPIFGVINLIDKLGENLPDAERKKYSELAQKESWRMADMIKNLQSFYKPSDEIFSNHDMARLLDDVFLIIGKACVNKEIKIQKRYNSGKYFFKGIEDQIKQVLFNVLQNSIDSISEGGDIILGLEKTSKEIILKIQDTGQGIAKENQKLIFDPFYTTRGNEGTGLGLSVSYSIIKKHGGDIVIDSELNIGSTVTLVLPI
jgi:PAS domain S-box-containing protein